MCRTFFGSKTAASAALAGLGGSAVRSGAAVGEHVWERLPGSGTGTHAIAGPGQINPVLRISGRARQP